jgi:hypothetical protein
LLPRVRAALAACVLLATPSLGAAQTAVDMAIAFYEKGGAYCFRIAPFGVGLSEETEWTVMMLTSKSNRQNTFRIRSVDAGETGVTRSGLQTLGLLANDVWKFDGTRSEFFERFAEGIRDGQLRARVVKLVPPRLSRASTERERADIYLDFADRGSKVSFDKVPDLTPEEFQAYSEHFID